MKKRIISLFLLALVLVSVDASARPVVGDTTYTPDLSSVTIPAGSQGVITTYIDIINSLPKMYYLTPVYTMMNGNLPIGWISASPSVAFLTPGTPVATTLTVRVPDGTPAGSYSGHVASFAMASHGKADPGNGFFIAVTVPPCSGAAEFQVSSPDTVSLWPPDHSTELVEITGTMKLPEGCTLLDAGYSIDDEYGVYTSVGTLSTSEDGNFTLTVPVEAWREGTDRDGRHYTITLFARDEAGTGSSGPITIVVPHDQRK